MILSELNTPNQMAMNTDVPSASNVADADKAKAPEVETGAADF